MKQIIDFINKKPIEITLGFSLVILLLNHIFFFSGYFGFDDIVYSQLSNDIIKGDYSLLNDPFAYRWTTIFPTALAYLIFGINDFARAIFPILTSVLIILLSLTFLKNKNNSTKLLSIILTFSSFWFFYYSDKIMADIYVAFSFISSIAIIFYYKFYKKEQPIKYAILLSLSLIFGFISKGTIILIIPIIGVIFINDIIKKENVKFWTISIVSSLSLLVLYFIIIKIFTGTYLMRFYVIEANSYFNECSYDKLPFINTIERISYKLIINFIQTGLFVPILLGLSIINKQRIKNILNINNKSSFIFLVSFLALFSANFMTISATSYVPMCIDIRHYLFLIPILSIAASIGLYKFISSNEIKLFIPISFSAVAILSAFLNYDYYIYLVFAIISIIIILFKTNIKTSVILFVVIMLVTPYKIINNNSKSNWKLHKTIVQNIIKENNKTAIITNDAEKQIINLYSNFDSLNIKTFNFREIDNINFSKYNKIYWFSYWLTEFYTGLDYYKLPLIIRDNDSTLNYYFNSKSLHVLNQNTPIVFYNNFESSNGKWSNNEKYISPNSFSTTLYENINEFDLDSHNNFARASISYKTKDTSNAKLVITIGNNEKNILWKSVDLSDFYNSNSEWNKAILETKIPNIKDGFLKTYIWNTGNDTVLIDNFKLIIF